MRIGPTTSAARNVVAGFLRSGGGPSYLEVPEFDKPRNETRLGYRKTPRRRGEHLAKDPPKREPQLTLEV